MSGSGDVRSACDAVRDDLAEVALGVVTGRRRAEVLEHVGRCADCSAELEELTRVTDALVSLSGEVEPPVGFELRLADRLAEGAARRRPGRARRAGVWALAAASLVAVGIGVGSYLAPGGRAPTVSATAPTLATAALSVGGQRIGEVFVSSGRPARMFMSLESGTWTGPVTCEVVLANGRVEVTGHFVLAGGYGEWGATLRARANEVRAVQLVTTTGAVYASARFPV